MHGMEIVKLQSISFIIALSTAGVTGWPADACLLCDKAVVLEVMAKEEML
jgi:hypothetical protein